VALVALGVLAVDASAAPTAQRVQILADRVDVRSYSSPEAPVIASVSRGTVLEVLAREGDWIRIPIPKTGYPGYVPAVDCQFVQLGVTPALPPAPQAAPVRPPAAAPTPAPVRATARFPSAGSGCSHSRAFRTASGADRDSVDPLRPVHQHPQG
jgi:hypothetical protein